MQDGGTLSDTLLKSSRLSIRGSRKLQLRRLRPLKHLLKNNEE